MQLVFLYREQVFRYLTKFLNHSSRTSVLEERGIVFSVGRVIKGTLVAILGDNLGFLSVRGFVENFSRADHFCLYLG